MIQEQKTSDAQRTITTRSLLGLWDPGMD